MIGYKVGDIIITNEVRRDKKEVIAQITKIYQYKGYTWFSIEYLFGSSPYRDNLKNEITARWIKCLWDPFIPRLVVKNFKLD